MNKTTQEQTALASQNCEQAAQQPQHSPESWEMCAMRLQVHAEKLAEALRDLYENNTVESQNKAADVLAEYQAAKGGE